MLTLDKTLIVIVGPTGIGKTDLAIKLAKNFDTEIISADSRQFFREMEIGTAKPSPEELKAVQHHFINSHSITSEFSVGDFEQQALKILKQVFIKKDVAILVGGSGLYVQAVCQGFDNIPKASTKTREKLNQMFGENGIEAIQNYLKKIDPQYYGEVDTSNPQRMIRALEVWETTGKPFSSFRIKKTNQRPFNILQIGLNTERQVLYKHINQRFDRMMQAGLLNEVKNLLPYRNLNALNTVGYSELFDYLDGLLTLPEAVEKIKQNTRRFAKRQLTWFLKSEDVKWFEPGNHHEVLSYLKYVHYNPEPSA